MPEELQVHVRVEDGSLWATVDQFPGLFASGESMDELRESLEEAIAFYLEDERGVPTVHLSEFHQPLEMTTSADLVCA